MTVKTQDKGSFRNNGRRHISRRSQRSRSGERPGGQRLDLIVAQQETKNQTILGKHVVTGRTGPGNLWGGSKYPVVLTDIRETVGKREMKKSCRT